MIVKTKTVLYDVWTSSGLLLQRILTEYLGRRSGKPISCLVQNTQTSQPVNVTRAVMSQGNRAMQRVFPTPNDSSIVILLQVPKDQGQHWPSQHEVEHPL